MFGLEEQDISQCHKTDPACFGTTVYDDNFSLESQQAQDDIVVRRVTYLSFYPVKLLKIFTHLQSYIFYRQDIYRSIY